MSSDTLDDSTSVLRSLPDGLAIGEARESSARENTLGSAFFDRHKTYRRFQEIDWLHEHRKERQLAQRAASLGSFRGALWRAALSSEKWVVIIAAALLTGAAVSFIDSASVWTNDVRNGYCTTNLLHSRVVCCDEALEGETCLAWHDWQLGAGVGHFLVYILSCVVLACAAFVVTGYGRFAAKSGISEIKAIISGLVFDEFLSAKVLGAKIVSLVLVVGAGLWVGKEGPLVHVSCCVMSAMYHITSRSLSLDEAMKRVLLAAAVAAGIAVAFNAPIGGVLFILEQGYLNLKISSIMWKSFICATIAVVVLQSLHPFTEGRNVLFTVSNNKDWLSVEMFPFMLLGALGGIYGSVFSKLNLRFARFRTLNVLSSASSKKRQIIEMVAVATATLCLTYPLVFGRLSLSLLITRLFRDCDSTDGANVIGGLCSFKDVSSFQSKTFALLVLTGIQGFVLSAYTYGMLVPSGILMPSLAIGACFGRALGLVIDYLQVNHPHWSLFSNCPAFFAPDQPATAKCISTGAYGVIGAASFLAGITKMTVSVVVIMFELTGAVTYVLPIMITVLVAKVINDGLIMKNFFELWLRFSGFYSLDQNYKDLKPVPEMAVKEIMFRRGDVPVFYLDDTNLTVEDLLNVLKKIDGNDFYSDAGSNLHVTKDPHTVIGFPVLESRDFPALFGWISRNELRVELQRLSLIPHYDIHQRVSFTPPQKPGATPNLLDMGPPLHPEFDTTNSEESAARLLDSPVSPSLSPLLLSHLIETEDVIPIFKSTLSIATVADLFYKVNYNYMLFTDTRGRFEGIVTKYYIIHLIESNFRDFVPRRPVSQDIESVDVSDGDVGDAGALLGEQ